jgi:hypothetical protein
MCILQWNKTVKHFYMQRCYGLHKRSNNCTLLKVTNNQKCQQQTNVYLNSIINMNYPLNDKANNTNYTTLIYLIGMSPNTSLPLSQK